MIKVKCLIENNYNKEMKLKEDFISKKSQIQIELFDEICHHYLTCENLCRYESLVSSTDKAYIYAKINDNSNKKPFIITGQSGVGKSTLIASLANVKLYIS